MEQEGQLVEQAQSNEQMKERLQDVLKNILDQALQATGLLVDVAKEYLSNNIPGATAWVQISKTKLLALLKKDKRQERSRFRSRSQKPQMRPTSVSISSTALVYE